VAIVLALLATVSCGARPSPWAVGPTAAPPPSAEPVAPTSPAAVYAPQARTKESACQARGPLPDPACTPGAVMTTDIDVICHQATGPRRNVPASVHREAFTDYGFTYPQARGAFEVDHLIPLELGGDNVIANLWAEPATPTPGFHQKDLVENYLHRQVCAGSMTLADAQRMIATDWMIVWRHIEGRAGTESDSDGSGE
jgi:hypothetical protein